MNYFTQKCSIYFLFVQFCYLSLSSQQGHSVARANVKAEYHQKRGAALQQPSSEGGNLNPSQYVTAQEHREPMQIPSNSMPSESSEQDCQKNGQNTASGESIDSESIKGIFGWETVDDTSIPYILRKQRKFVSVRIVERKLLSKYPNTFPDELGKKDPLVSYFITEAEANLLNEINTAHCDFEYGHNPFTVKDLIVDLEEFEDFFKIVKKTFPADVLAKINEEPAAPVIPSPVKPDVSQFCGWLQINNTVSPYIVRFENGTQVKLVPVSVIVHAAGLLTNSSVDGLLPTPQECAMLNEACRVAGFDFLFGKNTRLISITEVLRRCQVQLFELPFKNPLQYARYLDPRSGQPSTNSLMGPTHPASTKTTVHHQPQTAVRPPQPSMDQLSGNQSKLNSYASGFPHTNFHPSQLPGSLSGVRTSSFQEPAMMHYQRSHAGMGMDPSHLSNPRSQTYPDKSMENSVIKQGLPGSLWSMMPRAPPPAHVNNAINSTVGSDTLSATPDPPSASVYQPHSLPPNPLLHSTNSPMPDLNNPIFRGPMGMPARSLVTQSMHKDLPAGIAKYATSVPGLPPPSTQYSNSQPFPYGVNQFDSSLFKRSNSQDQRTQGDNSLPGSRSNSQHRTGTESLKHPVSRSSNSQRHTAKTRLEQSSHINTAHPSNPAKNAHPCSNFSHAISACLVNGKSISCINVDLPHRNGRFCLVEAVSKLYFPTVPLAEFLKVLHEVLKVNLHECTSEEEAAFVQYYNLPVNKLKCNRIIKVDDLEMYFPQLNYMFTKCSPDANQVQVDYSLASAHSGTQKRKSNSTLPGPPAKTMQSKIENVVRMLQHGKDNTQNGGE